VREYQQLVVRSFLLATRPKVVANTIRTIVKSRDVMSTRS